jgi:uncharacterized membrane protein YqaE (UPF0057 family)
MRTKVFNSASFILILYVFLPACALLQKSEFAQRKYYYFPLTKSISSPIRKEITTAHNEQHAISVVSNEIASVQTEPIVTAKQSEIRNTASLVDEQKKTPLISTSIISKTETATELGSHSVKKEFPLPTFSHANSSSMGNSDIMLLLELILAIFIPPLAVYIHNGRIDRWFWITLILCLIGGGFMIGTYTGYFGLFWAAAVIIAICYVLGIIRG